MNRRYMVRAARCDHRASADEIYRTLDRVTAPRSGGAKPSVVARGPSVLRLPYHGVNVPTPGNDESTQYQV